MLLFLCTAANVFAQTTTFAPDDGSDTPSQPRQYFSGDWGGERTSLASKGVTFDLCRRPGWGEVLL
jgi:carbohydrate-selective porin OprB